MEADFKALPPKVLSEANSVLTVLQSGAMPKGKNRYASLDGDLKGIDEIKIDGEDGNTYRIYDIIRFEEVIYILNAGAKKSKKGNAIPQADVDRLLGRKKLAEADYKVNESKYKVEYEERSKRRAPIEEAKKLLEEANRLKPKGT